MRRLTEVVTELSIEATVLEGWIEQRWVRPTLTEGEPLFDEADLARARLISAFDLGTTVPEWALGFRFDIVLRGRDATPFEEPHHG